MNQRFLVNLLESSKLSYCLITTLIVFFLPSVLVAQSDYPSEYKSIRLAQDYFLEKRPALSINGFDATNNTGRGLK